MKLKKNSVNESYLNKTVPNMTLIEEEFGLNVTTNIKNTKKKKSKKREIQNP